MSQIINCYVAKINQPRSGRALNLRYFNLGLLAIMASLGVCYLINISQLTVQGFALRDLKSQVAVLANEKAANEELVNSIQSYYSLNERTKNLDMVALGDVKYLAVNRPVVAKR
ncbi:MAG: hypothetical protein WC905_01545 [Patescibacteria group bacterium]|jgi:hypothetical protein